MNFCTPKIMASASLCLCLDANEIGCSMTNVVKDRPIASSGGEVDWSINRVLELRNRCGSGIHQRKT